VSDLPFGAGAFDDVDTVLLDAGGVLLLPDPQGLREALGGAGVDGAGIAIDDERARRAHYACMAELDRLDRLDWPAVDAFLLRHLGVAEELVEDLVGRIEEIYVSRPWVPIIGAAEALIALQDAGFRLAVVSNATGTIEAQLLEGKICSLEGHRGARVEVVIDSHVVGVEKPDPRIFEIALEAIGGHRDRCVYVGDTNFFDVRGARAAGIRALHADPYGFCPHRDHPHIRGVEELVGRLRPDPD
jgi:putative hydrolase of the HAD superfamily